MRVLLMNPYPLYRRWPTTPEATMMLTNTAPVTLALLAAAIPEHDVRIFDGNVERPPLRDFVELVRWADVVGISIISTYAALNTELNVRFIKEVAPGTTVILGGHHATFNAEEWLKKKVDVVVRNEGEQTLAQVLETLETRGDLSRVDGISYSVDGTIRHNRPRDFIQDIDTLPFPAWDKVDFSRYNIFLRRKGLAAGIESSRGCNYKCSFCQSSAMWRHRQRFKSPNRFMAELEDLYRKNVRQLFVVDDNFGSIEDRERVSEIYRLWRDSGMDMEWGTSFRVDAVLNNPALVEEGARFGLSFALVGYELLSQKWIEEYNKAYLPGITVNDYKDVYRLFRKNNVLVGGFLVIGYPGQTLDDIKESVRRFRTFCDYPIVTLYKPLKGTVSYKKALQQGMLTKDMFYHDSQIPPVKGVDRILRYYNRFFLWTLVNPKNLLSYLNPPHPGYRYMMRSVYRWFLKGILRVNADNFRDFVDFLVHRSDPPQALMDRLVSRYLNDEYVKKLAAPFSKK